MLAGAAEVGVDEEDFAADFGDGDGEVAGDGGFAFAGAGGGEDEGAGFGVVGRGAVAEEDGDEGGAETFGDGGGFALEGGEFDAGAVEFAADADFGAGENLLLGGGGDDAEFGEIEVDGAFRRAAGWCGRRGSE